MANSWMQTPAGFAMLNGRAVLTNFWQAALNHSTLIRFVHTVIASWITGSFFVAGISAYYLLNKRFKDLSRATLKLSLIILIITSLFELILGHAHSVQVARTQPAKMAAFEALYHTRQGAPLALFGFPDEKNQQNHFYIGLPYLLSFLIDFDFNAKVQGLSDFPEGERPPVFLPFVAYHVMILLAIFFIALSLVGAYLLKKKKLWETKWYLTVLAWAIPLPHVANQFGWLAAEVGRQPWAVYQVLKTADAVSVVVPAGQVLFSLLMFGIIYLIVFLAFVKALLRMIKKGPTVVKA